MVQIVGILMALAGVGALLYASERLFPAVRGQPLWRRDSSVDLLYWLVTPLVIRAVSKILAFGIAVIVLAAFDRQVGARINEGFGPVAQQPQWLMLLELLVLGDLIGYWVHRWFHGRRLWRFHAVHHSSRRLDWLSALRVHPVNDLVTKLVQTAVLACLGFPLKALAGYVLFLTFYSALLHANLNWSFGPLRYVIASPLFHRWHHTTEEQGLDKNYALVFPLLDLVFGTFYLPRDVQPTRFGTSSTRIPDGYIGQILFPFRRVERSLRDSRSPAQRNRNSIGASLHV
jgi:sterol desaturase/sphingolipid hydroxylase (fatty acid hydroxylase superfamily)